MNRFKNKNVLIISAHADDEVFGMGGVLSRLSNVEGLNIFWLITTKIWTPKWNADEIISRNQSIKNLINIIGIKQAIHWDYKDNCLDLITKNELQEKMINLFDHVKPNFIFTPSPWDFNFEHRLIFEIVEMSAKAYYSPYIEEIIAYEIPSSTESSFSSFRNFNCNVYFNISDYIEKKMELINLFESQLHIFPHPRSEGYVISLAKKRGGESGLYYAEGFHLLRTIIR